VTLANSQHCGLPYGAMRDPDGDEGVRHG
jgi:hypothetical protein